MCVCVCVLQVNEKVSQYACYMFEPLDLSQWSVAHEEDEMIVSGGRQVELGSMGRETG